MEETMLKLSEFSHNHHPSWVKIMPKFISRGIRVFFLNSAEKRNKPAPGKGIIGWE
jgi:hypothetical protein